MDPTTYANTIDDFDSYGGGDGLAGAAGLGSPRTALEGRGGMLNVFFGGAAGVRAYSDGFGGTIYGSSPTSDGY